MCDFTIGFIGFGLIGGSIAKSLKELHKDYTIIAYNYYRGKVNSGLIAAKEDGVIDIITEQLQDGFDKCDIVFLCAPVLTNLEYMKELKNCIQPSCIITDVGSVKGNIFEAAVELSLEENFIGGHPMAGSEKTGYEHASAALLENAYYILTPTTKTKKSLTDTLYKLVEDIGSIPIVLDCYEHDDITAAISHVPHIIAANLVNMVQASDDSEKMRTLAAGGFRDITRIASSSAVMWQNICLTNTRSILFFLKRYITSLQEFEQALAASDEEYLYNIFQSAAEFRDSIPKRGTGVFLEIFEIYLDIIDEAGAIATIATILATNHISIKNIGVVHNREFQEGVLRVEFYDKESSVNAIELLKKYSYNIYER